MADSCTISGEKIITEKKKDGIFVGVFASQVLCQASCSHHLQLLSHCYSSQCSLPPGGGGGDDTGTTSKVTNCSGNGRGEAQTDLPNLCAFHVVLPPRSPCSSAEPSKTERINPESCRQAYS